MQICTFVKYCDKLFNRSKKKIMKAFIGMGLLGSNFVKAMTKKGYEVQVWNRTAAKAKALEAYGATAIDEVTEAVRGAETIHVTLKDDDSVNEILAIAQAGFTPGAVIIDHTTTSAQGAVQRTALWKERGFTYLHAPVFMGPQNALESTGYMLVSGDQAVIGKLEAELSALTGKLINLGPEEGKAAGMKLIGNLFLLTLTAGLSDTLALAKAQGISPADVLGLFDSWNPGASLPARLNKILQGNFEQPSWELNMARKDAGLMMEAAKTGPAKLSLIPVIAAEMDNWIAKGHGNDDWSIITKGSI
jgi:3-hydroxyisobutyrate dehydrogenase